MPKIKVVKRKVDFEKESKLILNELNNLNDSEKAGFFYFFTKNNNLFQSTLDNTENIPDLIITAEDSIRRDFKLDYSEKTINSIISVYAKYIKGNKGTSANYFGTITLLLTLNFLNEHYNELCPESDIYVGGSKLNNTPIDIVCEKKIYDLVESKFTIKSNIYDARKKIDELKKIIEQLNVNGGRVLLTTLDFRSKKSILNDFEGSLSLEQIFTSEALFNISMT